MGLKAPDQTATRPGKGKQAQSKAAPYSVFSPSAVAGRRSKSSVVAVL